VSYLPLKDISSSVPLPLTYHDGADPDDNRDRNLLNPWCEALMSKYRVVENQSWVMPRPGERFHKITRRSGLSYGRGRSSSSAFATLKMEVFAPIPMPRDNTLLE